MRKFLSHAIYLKSILIVLISLLLIVLCMMFLNLSIFNPVERSIKNFHMTDMFYEIHNSDNLRDTSDIITIVDMTSIYDRSRLANIIDSIKACEPAVIGVDIVFEGLRGDTVGSERVAEVVCADDGVPIIWAKKLTQFNDTIQEFKGNVQSFFMDFADADEGYTNVQRDINGGTVRTFGVYRMANGVREYSLPARVAAMYKGDSIPNQTNADQTINYYATYFPVLAPEEISKHPELIRGRIVIFGATHDEQDMHYTPIGKIAGVEVLAYATQTMLKYDKVATVGGLMLWLFTLLAVLCCYMAQNIVKKRCLNSGNYIIRYLGISGVGDMLVKFVFIVLLAYLCYILYVENDIYINTVYAMVGIALLATARKFYDFVCYVLNENKETEQNDK